MEAELLLEWGAVDELLLHLVHDQQVIIIIKVIITKMVRMMIININIVLMNLIVIIIDNVCVRNADDNMSDKCG